ncbi:hypothetical protein BISA_0873 [Bifidobacterium saguini DSM 23967]|uniref:Uncharacterized protein n=2 Tax=Bifidobacterium saguini TaxID=762210 RepID=A0A087DAC1_9BIFI|nr:hypothetical protein [Bifidobacterium saguini]KFI92471.1 hypothetical protein BISA_0873 [Bifidobacterium saguini DSM 23967]QTB90805.1 hypothetical protein BSD967_11060 [Bifidobacterium saguini]QTB90867.1 hypothetical protein BSD967_11395 [Bifidobacterium saguini]
MNTFDYGRHASGFRRPGPDELPHGFMPRLVLWLIVLAVCVIWLLSHDGCAHPLGNGLAALVGLGFVPLRLVCLFTADALDDDE